MSQVREVPLVLPVGVEGRLAGGVCVGVVLRKAPAVCDVWGTLWCGVGWCWCGDVLRV